MCKARGAKKLNFKKEERISGEKDIELLFENGHSFKAFPLRVVFIEKSPRTTPSSISIIISVPKRRFKHAVERNHIKRLVREVYRLNNAELKAILSEKDFNLLVAFIYIGPEVCDYKTIEAAMQQVFGQFKDKFS